mmetsp:Transcript_4231/g.6674  ORF Transcript_4231/g.6674 Transcript_4231/m.6674 type:complete len:95 (+) Transcript_4231:2-286(+)
MECLWEIGGVSCEVIRGGTIQVGETILLLDDNHGRRIDDGGKLDAFYVRPKARSAKQVKEMMEGKKKSKEILMETDKEGLLRLQASYESVGLKY